MRGRARSRPQADGAHSRVPAQTSRSSSHTHCSGTLAERAERLFAVRGLTAGQVPPKLRGPGYPGPQLPKDE